MSCKSKISKNIKITAIEEYLRGEDSLYGLAAKLGIYQSTVKHWLQYISH